MGKVNQGAQNSGQSGEAKEMVSVSKQQLSWILQTVQSIQTKSDSQKQSAEQVCEALQEILKVQNVFDFDSSEKRLVEAERAVHAASLAKTHFLANISHEIRTPLSAMMGFSELMMDPHLSIEDKNNHLSVIRRNGQQLLRIIDEILDISKVESGKFQTEILETDLKELLVEIHKTMRLEADAKGLDLQIDILNAVPDRVMTDPVRFRQILSSLINNAIKFTHEGEVRIQAEFQKTGEGTPALLFHIRDTGIGISPEISKSIFTPFMQADASTTRLYGGTGLGLALARRLAQCLGGNAWLVESEIEKGSTFAVKVKCDPAANAQWLSQWNQFTQKIPTAPISPVRRDLEGVRVLLVEDAEDNQILIGQFLRKAGALVDLASNGLEGVELALAGNYSVVLMDIQMPLMDGYEATARLRRAGYKLPIVALTAHAMIEERERAFRTGCDGHLTKPISRAELIANIKKLSQSEELNEFAM